MDKSSVLVVVSFNCESINLRVDVNYNLLKFKEEIYKTWPVLRHMDYELLYKLHGNDAVFDSDTGIQSLAFLCFYKKIGKVDVDISVVKIVGLVSSELPAVSGSGGSDLSSIASTSSTLIVGSSHEVQKSLTWGIAITGKGQKISSKKEFVSALLRYNLHHGFKYRTIKNERTLFTACCSLKESDNQIIVNGTSGLRLFKDKPSLKPSEVINEMQRDYRVPVNYYYARVGKKLAVKKIYGEEACSYSQLTFYMNTLKERDPDGRFILETHQKTTKFSRIFIAFEACIHVFQYCRPLLFLKACQLKTKYKGCLMAATGKNADNGFYPLAYVVVSTENDDKWEWFLGNLKSVVFPNSSHGYCLWHLWCNLRASIKGPSCNRLFINELFKVVAYAFTPVELSVKLNDLLDGNKENKQDVIEFWSTVPYEHWANAFFPGQRYRDMCSSNAESFNSWVGEERFLPITSMLDRIRRSNRWTSIICLPIQNKLKERIDASKTWTRPVKSSETLFEVHNIRTNIVNLENRTCSCRRWTVEGIPCVHSLHCIISDQRDVEDFVDPMFRVFAYRQNYANHIPPIIVNLDDIVVGEDDVIKPPDLSKQRSRPKTKRIPNVGSFKKRRFTSKICMDSFE
ncbi:hypothetical protein AQUCO_00600184v1 [Aquilegia coerulea]|uniref:SWIM-type domain-containing protein n=1 Tax=Aquilegia coerulea TaxID=218851 RepID=A0A2G5ENG4_AQUCA|nr:hypothetical protein AQUCO_00600184v1 [Aquilegia coerulea]